MYEGLHLICFQCGQYGHKQEICPHASQGSQDETSEREMADDPLVPIVRPEIMESFGSWMIADRRHRRPSKRLVMEEKKGNGKGGDQAVNLGKNLKSATDSQLMVSTRYNALMATDEDSEDFGAGEKRGMQIKEIEAGGSASNTQLGRPLGQKKQRANSGPRDKRAETHDTRAAGPRDKRADGHDTRAAEKSPTATRAERSAQDARDERSPQDARAEKRLADARAEKRPADARVEKRSAAETNSAANANKKETASGVSAKGKEKITGQATETRWQKINNSRMNSSLTQQQEEMMNHGCRTEHEFYQPNLNKKWNKIT